MRGLWFLAVVGLLASVACKADAPEPAAVAPAGSAAPASPPAARVPIAKLMPDIPGAKLIGQRTRDDSHAITTLCIDEQDATERVMAALRRDGWDDIRTRGTGNRIGVAASKAEARFAASTGGRDERCAGTLISATVMRLGQVQLPPADKIR